MEITVAGTGYVGLVAGVCFAEVGHSVTCIDSNEEKILQLQKGKSPIYEQGLEAMIQKNLDAGRLQFSCDYKAAYARPDAIFIGVGTPEREDGSADLSYVASVARQIAESLQKDCLVVLKSTVPVGTNDKVERLIKGSLAKDVHVEVASNPEFLSQGTAVHDMMHAARIVIGTNSASAEATLQAIYKPFDLPVVSVSRRSAEMIKYASNVFLALKISYMNDIANLCDFVGADIQDVAKGMAYDDRIGAKYLNAGTGYGGSCLSKDSKALQHLALQHNYELKTVSAAIEVNEKQRTLMFWQASKRLLSFSNLKVAVLGLAFKPGTDDLRDAPAIYNIPLLLQSGAFVSAYDPVGAANAAQLWPKGAHGTGSLHYAASPEEALAGADICFIFTEWPQIKALKPIAYKQCMSTALVYDGRNLYLDKDMKEAGVEYYSIGRPSPA